MQHFFCTLRYIVRQRAYVIHDAIIYSKRPLLRLRPVPSNNELSAVKAHCIDTLCYIMSYSVTGSRSKMTWDREAVYMTQPVRRIPTPMMSRHQQDCRSVPPLTHCLYICHHIDRDHPRCASVRPLSSTCMQLAVSRQERSVLMKTLILRLISRTQQQFENKLVIVWFNGSLNIHVLTL